MTAIADITAMALVTSTAKPSVWPESQAARQGSCADGG